MNGVAPEVSEEIRMLFQHRDANPGPREEQSGNHPRRAAADDAKIGFAQSHG